MFVITTALKKLILLNKKIRGVQGGTSASKTISILQDLIDRAQRDISPTLTSIVSESIPHLKKGAVRDFKKIMKEHHYWLESNWHDTDKLYTFETGSQIEFFGADQHEKLRGGRRDRLFINEANNVSFQAFEELEVRTKEFCYLDWNPTNAFWFYSEVLEGRTDVDHIILTYLDNEGCPEEIIASIEQRRNRIGWWKVYGLGELGEVEGKIYKDWKIIETIPHEARLVVRGLDFGYSNDPTALVDIYEYNGGYIFDEQVHRKGMKNKQIADFINSLPEPEMLVIADSAEPKSIDEIRDYGVTMLGAQKGQGSVKRGIDFVQTQRCSITKRSTNVIKSYRNYLWKTDRDGKVLNVPEHEFSDPMDAIRYGLSSLKREDNDEEADEAMYNYIEDYPDEHPQTTAIKQDLDTHAEDMAINSYINN